VPKTLTVLRPGGEPLDFRLRDSEALTTLMIEFQEAFSGGRAKQVVIVEDDGRERTILFNGRQVLGVILRET